MRWFFSAACMINRITFNVARFLSTRTEVPATFRLNTSIRTLNGIQWVDEYSWLESAGVQSLRRLLPNSMEPCTSLLTCLYHAHSRHTGPLALSQQYAARAAEQIKQEAAYLRDTFTRPNIGLLRCSVTLD
jgi:hypothetical protein